MSHSVSFEKAVRIISNNIFKDEPSEVEEYNQAITTIAKKVFFEDLENPDQIKEKLKEFRHLVNSSENANHFINLIQAIDTVVRGIELNRAFVPEELEGPVFHRNTVREALAKIQEGLSNGNTLSSEKNLSQIFRDYCDFTLIHQFPGKSRYLLRFSSIPDETKDGVFRQYFVVSRRRPDCKDSLHTLIAYLPGEAVLDDQWAVVHYPERILIEPQYQSLSKLISDVFPQYIPVGPLAGRKFVDYVNGYFSDEIKKMEEDAEELWRTDFIMKFLRDPIMDCRFQNPVLAPDGQTYSFESLMSWINKFHRLPTTREQYDGTTLRSNPLVAQVIQIRIDQLEGRIPHTQVTHMSKWKKDPILSILKDPLTGELLEDPVMATDNVTYSRASIEKFLEEHGQFPPNSYIRCRKEDLIPNITIRDVIEARINQILTIFPSQSLM